MYSVDYDHISFFHPRLREVMRDLEDEFGDQVITSLWRKEGVHGTIPLRAVDLRCRNMAHGREIERWVNDKWIYDPTREGFEVCLYHDTGQGIHLHVQVDEHTLRR